MKQVIIDPTDERVPIRRTLAARSDTIVGRVALLDIAKPRGDVFLHRLGERFAERGIAVKHYAKPTNTRVAPLPLRQRIAAEVNLVVEGLSD